MGFVNLIMGYKKTAYMLIAVLSILFIGKFIELGIILKEKSMFNNIQRRHLMSNLTTKE